MEINPYTSPAALAATTEGDAPIIRPLGITLLSVLFFLGGLSFAGLMVFLVSSPDRLQSSRPFPPTSLIVVVGSIVASVAFASSFGMWRGRNWAWWLVAWYYFSMLSSDLCQLRIGVPLKLRSLDYEEVQLLAMRQGVGAIINALLLGYLFKSNVLRFFGLAEMPKLRAIGILFGVTLVFMVVVAVLTAAYFIASRA